MILCFANWKRSSSSQDSYGNVRRPPAPAVSQPCPLRVWNSIGGWHCSHSPRFGRQRRVPTQGVAGKRRPGNAGPTFELIINNELSCMGCACATHKLRVSCTSISEQCNLVPNRPSCSSAFGATRSINSTS